MSSILVLLILGLLFANGALPHPGGFRGSRGLIWRHGADGIDMDPMESESIRGQGEVVRGLGVEELSKRTVAEIVMSLRAGCTTTAPNSTQVNTSPVGILISTTVGSTFLDKKKRLSVPRNSTVGDLKLQLQQKFPGSPPTSLQRLFFGLRLLSDNELVANLSTLNPVPLMLDMLTGTSVYNKTLSVSQALEAYASIVVQQAYVGDRLRLLFSTSSQSAAQSGKVSPQMLADLETEATQAVQETAVYREMFAAINSSLHSTYADDISEALIEEADPETLSADTAAWRHERQAKSPITVALAQEFDLNLRGIKNFAYYSVLLCIFAMFGTNTQASSQLLVLLVPLMWVSKLRQLRLLAKLGVNFLLPLVPNIEFLMPLLAAPYQVIANEMMNRPGGLELGEEGVEDEERIPVVPTPKTKRKVPVVPRSRK